MALFNFATKEITLKIVYYGPGLSGKTTNLQYLYSILNPETKGKLLSLATEADRTLFFDFLPVELGKIKEFSIRFQLYTVPGQVRYNATRKVVLKGSDAVIFVADSQVEMKEQNIESFENMMDNLRSNNIIPDEIPILLQYNKRDLKNILSIDELNADLNLNNYHFTKASAINGTGVEDSYRSITKLLLKNISKKHKIEIQPAKEEKTEHYRPEVIAESAEVVPGMTKYSAEETLIEPTSFKSTAEETILVPEYELDTEAGKSSASNYDSYTEKKSVFEDRSVQAVKEEREIKEIPLIPNEKLNMVISNLEKISTTLNDLKNLVSVLNKDMQEIKEIRKEQKETNSTLKGIFYVCNNLKVKKRWFQFWR